MRKHRDNNVAGFIIPYKCPEVIRRERLDRNKMRVKKGHLRPSPNEEAQMIKEETEKRRKLRLKQVREQSKENAAKIRQAVKHEKHKQLMKLATEIKNQLEDEKAERVRHLEQQYDNSLRNIGMAHRDASQQPDWSEERRVVMAAESLRAELRGTEAMAKLREETSRKMAEAQRINMARKQALLVEKARASEIAAMPPPPPDPVSKIDLKRKPVKVMDMNTYSTSHYHLMNEHVVDRAGTPEQTDAREAAELEQERIKERALELKRLRQDQLERARVRHNMALEKELLKYDYNDILHDLSDLQRADRERRLRIVHNIPKQVFEPPNVRLEDREDKQKQMEQEFEDMYMAGTDYLGELSMALDPYPQPETPSGTASLDITTGSISAPLQEPTLPAVPPVLRDMTNMPKPRSPVKKPEKVLRNLMDRIKSQREEWVNSHSMMEVADDTEQGMGAFRVLQPEEPTPTSAKELSPPEKLARVTSPVEPTALQPGARPVPRPRQAPQAQMVPHPQPPTGPVPSPGHIPQAPGQVPSGPIRDGRPPDIQQGELEEILKQQQFILEQKRQLELKLQQLTFQQQNMQIASQLNEQQQSLPTVQPPATGLPPPHPVPVQQVTGLPPGHPVPGQQISSLSSSQTSNQPMNSIPPTHTTSSVPMTTAYQDQGYIPTPAYQPINAALTSAQLLPKPGLAVPSAGLANGLGPDFSTSMATGQSQQIQGQPVVSIATPMGLAAPVPVSTPNFVGTLPADGHTEQMRRVREYQQYLLARHEQSKKVLAETKAEIERRRDNLMQRYPKLDLTRLEGLGAKYLANQPEIPQQDSMTSAPAVQGQVHFPEGQMSQPAMTGQGQGQTVPITSLLASLASHPYYAQSFTQQQQPGPSAGASVSEALVNGVVGAVQTTATQPDINFDTNLRKNKFDNIRKSLPFDTDDSFQSPAVRVYEAYTSRQLDTTTGTETTEADTSTSTERGSPQLRPAQPSKFQPLQEESSESETLSPGSATSDKADSLTTRQEELLRQLADIQRQKEEIMQLQSAGQDRVQEKQNQLKAKLATVVTSDAQRQGIPPAVSTSETTLYPAETSTSEEDSPIVERRQNLSTILEVETPASSGRPSEGGQERLSLGGSSDVGASFMSRRSGESDGRGIAEKLPEGSILDQVTSQLQQQDTEAIAAYSGNNIQNILERAKRFETEVLEKLRRQTNAVLFDQKFDDSLEFDVSRRPVGETTGSGHVASLSSGSITSTPDDSLSTGPLNESDMTKSYDFQSANGSLRIPKSRDSASANGSFQTSKSWADELATYKAPFKVMKPELTPEPIEKQSKEESMFAGDVNRFKVYSAINRSTEESSSGDRRLAQERGSSVVNQSSTSESGEDGTLGAQDMLNHLRKLQEELRNSEQTRKILEKDLADRQAESHKQHLESYKPDKYESAKGKDLSQYSLNSDVSLDKDRSIERRPSPVTGIPILSGTSAVQRELPVRKSPIGDLIRSRSPIVAGVTDQDLTTTEYSFTMSDGKQRSTSTPGDERSHSKVDKSELPSEIRSDDKTVPGSSLSEAEFQSPKPHVAGVGVRREVERMVESRPKIRAKTPDFAKAPDLGKAPDLSTYSVTSETETDTAKESSSDNNQFRTLQPDSRQPLDSLTSEFTTGSFTSADESSQMFKKLASTEPTPRIKTYSLTMDGDLVSEHSDSDKSAKAVKINKRHEDLSTYSVSSIDESTQEGVNADSQMTDNLTELEKSNYTNMDEISEQSEESKTKSSLTNVTSDPSLNSMTGVSTLSQYTFQTGDLTGVPDLTQYTLKSDDATGAPDLSQYSLKSADVTGKSENKSANASVDEGSDYLQQKFASLDNLISESKTLIAKHKVLVDKNKEIEEPPKVPSIEEPSQKPLREVTPGAQGLPAGVSNVKKFKEWYMSTTPGAVPGGESDSSKLSSFTTDKDASSSVNKTDTSADVNSLEYLVEHSSGITEEQIPDLTTMTMGSEISINEGLNKTDMSDSDSLKSFEKHEMSTTADTESLSTSRTDDSWRASGEQSQSDSVQELVESRRQNFLAEAERRANIAKERALGLPSQQKKSSDDIVFRAVPVSVVAEPTLSMSASAGIQRGRSPARMDKAKTTTKTEQSVKDKKKSFEAKEAEMNRALQPRGKADAGSRHADAGTRPSDKGTRAKDTGSQPKTFTAPDRKKMGALTGEIKSFGGSAGLAAKQAYAKKIPPPTKPKPVRSKSAESGAPPPLPQSAPPQLPLSTTATGPSSAQPPQQATSSLSKTLSSWKKSRSLSAPAPALPESAPPKNSIKVLPEEAPEPLTEEEREQRATSDNVIYQRHMRLERQLDTDEPAPIKKTTQESPRSRSLDRKKPQVGLLKKKTKKR